MTEKNKTKGKNMTTGERMVIIETKLDNVENKISDQSTMLKNINEKVVEIAECKADKTKVKELEWRVNKTIIGFLSSLIGILILILGFLIQDSLF